MPKFSVIIPLFNKENFIKNTLESAKKQTFEDFEIIVVNDGSTDNGSKIVEEFKDSRINIFHTENKGVSSARNFGIEKASGEYIAFLDADDIWKPDFLETIYSLIKAHPDKKVFSCAIEIEIDNKIFPAEYSISKEKSIQIVNYFQASLLQSAIFTSGAVFHKSVFETAGNFDIDLKTEEDIDLWIRIGLLFPIVFTWKIGVKYSLDQNGLSKNIKNISQKTDFSNYSEIAKTNPNLQKFLDFNRYSFALKSKLSGEKKGFEKFNSLINRQNLNLKQRFLLSLPSYLLRKLFDLKLFLQSKNIHLSAFK